MITEQQEPEQVTDLVIAFDTTGSMSSYIKNVKLHITELIPKLFSQNPTLKISVVAFGDYCDMKTPVLFGNAYQVINLTDNQNELINFVTNAKNTSGGDSNEFYELVIRKITNETSWRENSLKSVLLIADSSPHAVGDRLEYTRELNEISWVKEATIAASKGIKFDTLTINKGVKWYQELSDITGGVCLDFKSNEKTSDLLEATALARGGEVTREAFISKSMSSEVTSDSVLSSVYSMYKTVIEK